MAACVTFHSGMVVSLGWRFWLCEVSPVKTDRGWIVEVELKGEDEGWRLCEAMQEEADAGLECQDMGYDITDKRMYVEATTEAGRDAWLVFIIQYLSKAGHLSRDQELTAYVSFGLAYED